VKIKIYENDNGKFFEIARLVDSPNFLKRVFLMRERLNLTDKLIPVEKYKSKLDSVLCGYFLTKEECAEVRVLEDRIEVMRSQEEPTEVLEKTLSTYVNPEKLYWKHVRELYESFGLGKDYEELLSYAILCGEVYGDMLKAEPDSLTTKITIENSRRNREWYWMYQKLKKNGKGFPTLDKKLPDENETTIRFAVYKYRDSLRTPINK